jgi:hypothetical protein
VPVHTPKITVEEVRRCSRAILRTTYKLPGADAYPTLTHFTVCLAHVRLWNQGAYSLYQREFLKATFFFIVMSLQRFSRFTLRGGPWAILSGAGRVSQI